MNHAITTNFRTSTMWAAISPYLQAARTYQRPRFFVFGGCYLLTALWWHTSAAPAMQCAVSANFASILCCFMALHLRRQFGSAAAGIVPGFATPHLVVGAVLSLFIWAVLPLIQASLTGISPLAAIAAHAVAAVFLALVVWQPKSIALLALSPVILEVVAGSVFISNPSVVVRFFQGEDARVSALLIGLGILAYPVAAFALLRLSDQNASFSDDIAIEAPVSDGPTSWLYNLFLARRDAVVEEHLARQSRRGWTVERWRVPVALSRFQLITGAVMVFALMAVAWLASMRDLSAAWFAMALSCGLMLLAPFGAWHWRRNSLGCELLRPVTRPQYFRQLAAALAHDVFVWTALASTTTLVVNCLLLVNFWRQPSPSDFHAFLLIAPVQFLIIWGAGVLLFGVSLVTLRFRYWLPLMVGFGVIWTVVMLWTVGLMMALAHRSGITESEWSVLPFALLVVFASATLLAWVAYRRSLESDLD